MPINYRNTIDGNKIKPGRDETVLLDYTNSLETAPALVVNGVVGLARVNVSPPGPQPSSPVPAHGHVYLDGSPVKGASVVAWSIDGADRASTVTDGSGAYVLNIEPGVQYKVTATYKDMKHTLWPLRQDSTGGINNINLTTAPKSVIIVSYQGSWYNDRYALIEAVPAGDGERTTAVTYGFGNYYLAVKPGRYFLGGRSYDPYGQTGHVSIYYPRSNPGGDIIIGPDETILADMGVTFYHAPKGMIMSRDPVTGEYGFYPSTPVTISGHVYLDGKPINGANVEAISVDGRKRTSNVTDDTGRYVLGLDSKLQYNVTATYMGRKQTVWPVHLFDNMTGVYNITLKWTTDSTITGLPSDNQAWLARPGNIITAIPVGRGEPIIVATADDGSYSIDLKPFVFYDISGKFQGPDGQYYDLRFY